MTDNKMLEPGTERCQKQRKIKRKNYGQKEDIGDFLPTDPYETKMMLAEKDKDRCNYMIMEDV